MRFRVRIRLWHLFAFVALFALALGIGSDVMNRPKRDLYAGREKIYLDSAADVDRERLICESNQGKPYPASDRALIMWGHDPLQFSSWDEEAAYHAETAKTLHQFAAQEGERKRYYQRRLLFP